MEIIVIPCIVVSRGLVSGMDWLCPGYSEVLARQLTLYHGNLTAELLMREVVPIVQTGSLQVWYSFISQFM